MSDPEGSLPTWPPAREPPPNRGNGCLSALLLFVGIILLLPGLLCVMVDRQGTLPLTGLAYLIAAGGVAIIIGGISMWPRRPS